MQYQLKKEHAGIKTWWTKGKRVSAGASATRLSLFPPPQIAVNATEPQTRVLQRRQLPLSPAPKCDRAVAMHATRDTASLLSLILIWRSRPHASVDELQYRRQILCRSSVPLFSRIPCMYLDEDRTAACRALQSEELEVVRVQRPLCTSFCKR
jgi:hypothetical protein